MRILIFITILFLAACGASDNKIHTKKVHNLGYKEDFDVVPITSKPSISKTYYWYKSNEVHKSIGDYGGAVLHGQYIKYFQTNEISEKGIFKYGLKDGVWKAWHKNGRLASIQEWLNGQLNGDFKKFSKDGNLIQKGKYKNDKKSGKWIDYIKQDTIVYKKDILVVKKVSDTTPKRAKLKNIFKKAKAPKKAKDTTDNISNLKNKSKQTSKRSQKDKSEKDVKS